MKRLLLTISLFAAAPAYAQPAGMQSPAYQECTSLANTNPAQALAKAEAWLRIDNGIAAQHCRAMALYGLHRFSEAADALATVRNALGAGNISLHSYVTRQAVRAYINGSEADKALALLNAEIGELGNTRGDNATPAHLTADLLLDRARLHETYGKLDESAKDLDHAVSLTPVNQEILLERAGVFEKLGDVPLAKNDLDAVLTINSGNSQARTMRDRLNGTRAGIAIPSTVVASPALTAPAVANTQFTAPVMPVEAAPQNQQDTSTLTAPTPMLAPTATPNDSDASNATPTTTHKKHTKRTVATPNGDSQAP